MLLVWDEDRFAIMVAKVLRPAVAGDDVDLVVGIGECGLDYYYDKSDRSAQRERFQAHIEAARQTKLPLVVHTRDAEEDTAEILSREVGKGGVTGVLHCFTSSAQLAAKALDLGFCISISGIVTFKNAKDLQEVARTIPQDRLLVETDAPYLLPRTVKPAPSHRRNEPMYLAHIVEELARDRGEDVAVTAGATSATANAFFRLPPMPG